MTNVRIPLTHIQTPITTTIKLVVPAKKHTIVSTTPFYLNIGSKVLFRQIGTADGLVSFKKEDTREITKLYGFNGDEMQPFVLAPKYQNVTLTVQRIIFYKNDFFELLGFLRGSTLYQENPFIIIEDQYSLNEQIALKKVSNKLPDIDTNVTLRRSIIYFDCWFTNNPIEYKILAEDLIIIPEYKIEVGKIFSTDETFGSLSSLVTSFILQQKTNKIADIKL